MEQKKYNYIISLNVRHPSRNLTEIYQALSVIPNIIPGRLCNFGEERKTIKGEPLDGQYADSWCGFGFSEKWQNSDIETLPDALIKILNNLSLHKELLNKITSEAGEVSLFIGWGIDHNHDTVFSWQLLRQFAELKINLRLDLYPPDLIKSVTEA